MSFKIRPIIRPAVPADAAAIAGFAAAEQGGNTISDVWVAPDFEGRGVGTALIGAIERTIRNRGHQAAEIEPLSANERALRLYRQFGYDVLWQDDRWDAVLGHQVNKIRLRKCFDHRGRF